MAIQGRDNADWWTTSYSLSYRVDGGSFVSYEDGQVSTNSQTPFCVDFIIDAAFCYKILAFNDLFTQAAIKKKTMGIAIVNWKFLSRVAQFSN